MKTKLLVGLALLATLGMTSCKKDKDEAQEATTVKIGNKDYSIVKIGNQTWTTENYSGEGGVYYNNNNSKPEYGKLYTFNEASAIQVPEGWRLPTKADYKKLFEAQGAAFETEDNDTYGYSASTEAIKKLMATTGWDSEQGTNTSGFNSHPAGYGRITGFLDAGSMTAYWTSTTDEDNYPYYFSIVEDEDDNGAMKPVAEYYTIDADYKLSIRFVKDNN